MSPQIRQRLQEMMHEELTALGSSPDVPMSKEDFWKVSLNLSNRLLYGELEEVARQ